MTNRWLPDGDDVLTDEYKENPTIENYVRLRRENPGAKIEVSVVGGLDQLFFIEPELRRHGIDPYLMASVLDADEEAISEIALILLERMIDARRLKASGQTQLVRRGLAIPDQLVNWIIACALDALSWNDRLHIPRDLIVLVRERLGGVNFSYEEASAAHQERMTAAHFAGQLLARGITPSLRMIADMMGVAPSTVKRWFPNDEFEREARVFASWYDEKGNRRPLRPKERAQHKSD